MFNKFTFQLFILFGILKYSLNIYLIALVVHPFVVGIGLNGVNIGLVLERYSQDLLFFLSYLFSS